MLGGSPCPLEIPHESVHSRPPCPPVIRHRPAHGPSTSHAPDAAGIAIGVQLCLSRCYVAPVEGAGTTIVGASTTIFHQNAPKFLIPLVIDPLRRPIGARRWRVPEGARSRRGDVAAATSRSRRPAWAERSSSPDRRHTPATPVPCARRRFRPLRPRPSRPACG